MSHDKDSDRKAPRVAVLVPCFNEAAAIDKVVHDFRNSLPGATVYVYDNNSSDRTVAVAREAGAVVRSETRQGKGHVAAMESHRVVRVPKRFRDVV